MARDVGYHRSSRRKSVACFCNFCEDKNFRFGIIRNRVGQRQVRAWSAMPPKVVASYPIATLQERNTMAETVTIDRPPVARAAVSTAIQEARDRQRVGAGAAPRLQPAIHRQARSRRRDPAARQGPPARSEPRCLSEILAGERRQSPRVEADADHVKVRTEMLQLRLMEKWRELVRRADVDALIDGSAGVTLTALFPHAARRVAILRPGQHRAGVCAPSWRRRPITEAK